MPGFSASLAAICAFLSSLRLFERLVVGIEEIGAAILAVGIEEEIVEVVADIVVMLDVLARHARAVELVELALDPRPARAPARLGISAPVAASQRLFAVASVTSPMMSPCSITTRPSMKASATPSEGLRTIAPGAPPSVKRIATSGKSGSGVPKLLVEPSA